MNWDHRLPAGPRPANQSPTRRRDNTSPIKNAPSGRPSLNAPMLSASSANNHSLFSFGRRNEPADDVGDTAASFDFLPSVSFDDLQSSLETASTDFKLTEFPAPTGQGSILGDQSHKELVDMMVERPNVTHNGGTTRVAIQQPPVTRSRTGSILRRPSTSSRQNPAASTTPGAPMNAPTAPAAMRPRRQSHYPPVSNSNIAKPPRKSVGPGLYDSDYESRNAQRRRPSMASLSDRSAADSTRTSVDGGSRPYPDTSRNLTASRTAKTRSMQPSARLNQSTLSTDNSTLTPDSNRLSTVFPRSPRGGRGSGPGSGKRVSVMPGVPHASHATGLGARTISPTDTRRMKRLSSLPPPQGQPQLPNVPPPPAADTRPASRSPSASMLPRKAPTPSSSRTTPDPNRKSYSSGLSITSTNSFNTARTSTGSIQPRMSLGLPPSSRLPAPKAVANLHNTSTIDDDEDVPPVPAIPKAYESPKESPAELSFFEKRKSTLAFDTSSIHSNSTGSITGPQSTDTSVKVHRKPSARKSMHTSKADMEKKTAASQRKNLQPLRLPPITLGPLSTPTAAKIAALHEQGPSERNLSPPPSRKTKTPTTPMTASKSTFFSRRHEEKMDNSFRSSSSFHHGRSSPLVADATSSSESIVAADSKPSATRSGMSPFLSSSVPKGGADQLFLKRHKTNGDYTLPLDGPADTVVVDSLSTKPSGPRAQKASARTKSPPPLSSPDEPPTPSSISSLRRKLSLSWKRSGSKNSVSHPTGDKTDLQSARQDSMPPPRIPASATYHNHSTLSLSSSKAPSPTPSAKSTKSNGTTTTYLESRRRKSSASSLNAIMSHDTRHRSDSLAGAKKETGLDTVVERSTIPHNSSVVQKILKPKPSVSTMRGHDVWTADLDKDDMFAEEEMKRLGSRRKETELAARTLDALRKRATPKERVGPQDAIRIAMLNIYERGEIVDYNDIYFCGTQNAAKVVGDMNSEAPNFGYDDERGDYTIVPGDHLAYRYEIIDILGKGSFGQVVRCIDHKTGVLVAVKIIRNKKRFHQQALVEVNILQKLREWDPKNKYSMVNFTHNFYFRGHLCISTELLDMNLYEFIKSNAFRGFSLKLIRRFTKQLLSSLNLLKQHKVIHCDLKPENILLRHPLHSEIKVIDFGSSCFENEKVYTYIQSRFYRSPEVILGMTYGMPIDMWSLGCILAELYTGVPIFPGENEQEQLACIMEVFGPPEKHLIEKSTRKKLFFDSMGKPRLTVSSKGRRRRPSSKTLQQVLKCDDEPFLDFLSRCLRWDPDRRMKPDEAIRHEFITGQKTSVPVPHRGGSPIKRNNTISVPRPLPEPPGGGLKASTSLRPRDATSISSVSPLKPGMASRRASGITASGVGGGGAGIKRTSTGTGTSFTPSSVVSGLPRAAGRSVSSKQDAVAGAAAAMGSVGRRA
ncbi:Dual specificity protein kinase pom1 [Coniochaeta hoffmannii]|uniref:Dual specificity protein kinase pom1 n=1 Tax=Coniochaeta hoffmannii TaxID=91930 RepID=A0AA38W0Y9_9PEZI|nr:Dual specificity protein kinase pom1 [Coniochaeta hoffmannii]